MESSVHSPQIDSLLKILTPLGYTLQIVPIGEKIICQSAYSPLFYIYIDSEYTFLLICHECSLFVMATFIIYKTISTLVRCKHHMTWKRPNYLIPGQYEKTSSYCQIYNFAGQAASPPVCFPGTASYRHSISSSFVSGIPSAL